MIAMSDNGWAWRARPGAHFEPFFSPRRGTRAPAGSLHGLRHSQAKRRLHLVLQRAGPPPALQDLPPRLGRSDRPAGAKSATTPLPVGLNHLVVGGREGLLRMLVRPILEAHGYSVLEAARG